jgi:hypothetical protein
MSLATLKKKSQARYNNLSVGVNGFSLSGGRRSAGYIGQSTQSRHLTRTLMKGNVVRGNGGCCGTYTVTNVKPSELACLNDPNIVKPAVMNTAGMIHTKYKWFWSGKQSVKPDSNQNATQSNYTSNLAKKTIDCTNNSYEIPRVNDIICSRLPALARPRTGIMTGTVRQRPICPVTKPQSNFVAISQTQYIQQLNAECVANDVNPVNHNSNCPLPV